MKASIILLSVALSSLALPASAIKLPDALTSKLSESNSATDVAKNAATDMAKNALTSYAATELGMSEAMVSGGLASIFKVAQDNLTTENFSELSTAIPDMSSYIDLAPSFSTSAITSLLGDSEASKAAQSASYLDSAFESLGIPKESLPLMISTVTSYLDSNGYASAAGILKQGLNFL
jgi:hypothetical protein